MLLNNIGTTVFSDVQTRARQTVFSNSGSSIVLSLIIYIGSSNQETNMRTNMIALYAVELMAIACLAYLGTSVNFTVEPLSKAIVGRLMVKNLLS